MHQFDVLAERLLRAGIAHRHVRRYVGELRDHYEDLVRAETAAGADTENAQVLARARLGSMEELAQRMIARPELRALSARFPRVWGTAAPLSLWIGIMGFLLVGLIGATDVLELFGLKLEGSPRLARFQAPADMFFLFLTRALPVAVGAMLVATALRQRLAVMWPAAGAFLLAALAAISQAKVQFALTPDAQGELSLGFGFRGQELPEVLLRTAVMFALMLAPLALKKKLTRPFA